MNEEHDPLLQQLFRNAFEPLPKQQFTASVMRQTRDLKLKTYIQWSSICVIVLFGAWYLYSDFLLQLIKMITQLLSTELIEIEASRFGWMLAPVNTLGGLGALVFGIVRRFRRRISSLGYAG